MTQVQSVPDRFWVLINKTYYIWLSNNYMKHLLSSIYGPVCACMALSWFCPTPSCPLGVCAPSATLALCQPSLCWPSPSAARNPLPFACTCALCHPHPCCPLLLLQLGSAPPHLHTLHTCGVMACPVEVVVVAVVHVNVAGVAVACVEAVGVAVAGVLRQWLRQWVSRQQVQWGGRCCGSTHVSRWWELQQQVSRQQVVAAHVATACVEAVLRLVFVCMCLVFDLC